MSHRIDPAFKAALEQQFDPEAFELHPSSVFGLWRDFRIAYFNPAWEAFAEANGGQPAIGRSWGLGACYLDAIPEPLLPFYRDVFARASESGATLHPVSHAYECPSAKDMRRFAMQVYALSGQGGFVVVNSLRVEAPHSHRAQAPLLARYTDADGIIHQCCHCRCVQSARDPAHWEWVPAWVARLPRNVSHTICSICFEYYYPGAPAV